MLKDTADNVQIMAIASPVGWWKITTSASHVLSIDYVEAEVARVQAHTLNTLSETEPETRIQKQLHCMLSRYFKGEPVDFQRVAVDFTQVSPFAAEVLSKLRTVPYGQTRHYQWLAEQLNNPNASRAVGGVLGNNPWPILIPCHRIVSKSGKLGGFMRAHPEGPGIKTGLLALEGVCLPPQQLSLTMQTPSV